MDLGPLALFAQVDAALPVAPGRSLRGAMEASVLTSLLGALTLHLGVLIAAFLLFEEKPALVDLSQEDRFLRAVMDTAPMREEEKPIFEEAIAEDPGRAVEREEGAFGEPDKREPSKRQKREGDLVNRIHEAGLHRALGSNLLGRGPLKTVMGDSKGFADKLGMAMAGHDGDVVVGRGSGMGLRGTGDGGGGPGFGKVGGMGSIEGGGEGKRVATRLKATKPKSTDKVTLDKFERAGFCQEADVMRVVQARRGAVQHCYETALRSRPELQGKISVSWRIGLDGAVAAAHIESSTVADPTVASCVLRQVKRWTFAKPDGGMCQIRFPSSSTAACDGVGSGHRPEARPCRSSACSARSRAPSSWATAAPRTTSRRTPSMASSTRWRWAPTGSSWTSS
ncbi:MAG: AgmX/PglI C-terminal domain-containing protein [bacterium]